MDIPEHTRRNRRQSTFDTSGYQTEDSPTDEEPMIPDWLWSQTDQRPVGQEFVEPSHQQSIYRPIVKHLPPAFDRYQQEVYRTRPTPQSIGQVIPHPTHETSVYRRSLKPLPPAFQRYEQELYRSSEPTTREPHSVRPLTSRRLRPFESGYNTEKYSSDEESQFPGSRHRPSLSPERPPLQSIVQENIQPSTQQLEYQKFLQQLPPAFAKYQQEIYGPREPTIREPQPSTQPLEYQQFLRQLPPAFARYQQEIYGPRDPITGEPLGAEPGPLRTSPEREGIVAEANVGKKPSDDAFMRVLKKADRKLSPIMNTELVPSARTRFSLPYLEQDRQLLLDMGFHVKEKIGQGGFGDIYKGVCNEYAYKRYRDESTADPNDPNSGAWNEVSLEGKYFALKFIVLSSDETNLINEAQYFLELAHINVVDIYCVLINRIPPEGEQGELIKLFMIMEFSELGDIIRFIGEQLGGELSEFLYKQIVRQTIDGLLYIHSKSIIHGDIKAENVLVFSGQTTGDYIFKYTDFGYSASGKDESAYKEDMHDLCQMWKRLLTFIVTDSEYSQLMRNFLDSLPLTREANEDESEGEYEDEFESENWIYETLQAIIDANPWLLE